jgi:O-antigen/teichoic acid export membrane protein
VVQSLTLVSAISSVIFPVMSKMLVEQPDAWGAYFRRWVSRVAGLMLLVCVMLAVALPVALPLWVGKNLEPASIQVGQILCIGVFANALGIMFYALVHAKGRADVTAKLHMIELPCFIGALVLMLHQHGIVGAAWAWTGRMVFDAAALAWLARTRTAADALQPGVTLS